MFETKSSKDKYCVITEQGDLGLGAQVLRESDQEVMKKYDKKKAEEARKNNKD